MQAKIEADLRLKLSVLDLLRGVSIRELVDKLFASVDHLQSDEAEGNSSSSKTDELINIEDIDAYLDNLSDAEVALILEGKVSVETGARS
ncbi:hypothetical protein HED51_22395 [Ochrobactrum grignonense]|nr:hypothetical protein [Brucella grignonensis]